MSENNKVFLKGAFILTLAGVVSKVLGAFYRIPLQNLTGDVGFYFYQQIYPFIAFMMIITLYSFPAAISKMGAQLGERRYSLRYFVIPNLMIIYVIVSFIAFSLYIAAPYLAQVIGEPLLVDGFYVAAFSLLCLPVLALVRGLFQADGVMEVTAYSQVIEQILRVFIIVLIAVSIALNRMPIDAIAAYGVLASAIGMLCATVFVVFSYISRRRKYPVVHFTKTDKVPYKYYIKTILFFGFAVTLNHMMFIVIQFADVLTVVNLLQKYGLSLDQAVKWKGIFDRAVPLIQLGMVVGSSFALALIPYIAEKEHSNKEKKKTIQEAIAISLYIAGGAVVGLFILYPEANLLLFQDMNGLLSMRIFVLTIVLLAFLMTVHAILQSFGEILRTALYICLLFLIKICFNIILVPLFSLSGAALSSVLSLLIISFLTVKYLKKQFTHLNIFKQVRFKAYFISLIVMGSFLYIIKWLVPLPSMRPYLLVYVLSLIVTGALLYFITLIRFGAFTNKQLQTLPLSSVWMNIEGKLNRSKKE